MKSFAGYSDGPVIYVLVITEFYSVWTITANTSSHSTWVHFFFEIASRIDAK